MSKIYNKKVSVGSFLKKGVDFKDSDILEIANEGKEVEGQFGMQDLFLVKLADGKEGNVGFNQTTINGLVDAYGKDAVNWIGKKVKAVKVKQNVAGKFVDVWYFAHPDAELTENGFIMVKAAKEDTNEYPEGEASSEEIPF
jgi:hypothetical protein